MNAKKEAKKQGERVGGEGVWVPRRRESGIVLFFSWQQQGWVTTRMGRRHMLPLQPLREGRESASARP